MAKDLKEFEKYERENKEKIRNNVDEAMEEKMLQAAVFSSGKEAATAPGRTAKAQKDRTSLALKAGRARRPTARKVAVEQQKEGSVEAAETRQ